MDYPYLSTRVERDRKKIKRRKTDFRENASRKKIGALAFST